MTLQAAVAPKKVDLELRLTTVTGLLAQDLRAAQRAARDAIGDYFARLPAREAGSVNQLVGLVLGVNGVEDVRIVSATVDGGEACSTRPAACSAIDGFPTVARRAADRRPEPPHPRHRARHVPESGPAVRSAGPRGDPGGLDRCDHVLNELNASEPAGPDPRRIDLVREAAARHSAAGEAGRVARVVRHCRRRRRALPDETSTGPYRVQFVFALGSGLSRILAVSSDQYELTPFERLALAAVEVQEQRMPSLASPTSATGSRASTGRRPATAGC